MAKMIVDASYKTRDKKKEAADFKAGKRANPGYIDLTKKPKEVVEDVKVDTKPTLTKTEITAAKKEAKEAVIEAEKAKIEAEKAKIEAEKASTSEGK